jgi:hypothetical protein
VKVKVKVKVKSWFKGEYMVLARPVCVADIINSYQPNHFKLHHPSYLYLYAPR